MRAAKANCMHLDEMLAHVIRGGSITCSWGGGKGPQRGAGHVRLTGSVMLMMSSTARERPRATLFRETFDFQIFEPLNLNNRLSNLNGVFTEIFGELLSTKLSI